MKIGIPLIILHALAVVLFAPHLPAQEERDGSFGFSGLQVFRLGSAGGPWHAADLDNDGDTDLAVWVGDRGELIQLLQDPETTGFIHRDAGNTLVDPDGWKRESLAVRSGVDAIASGDLDGDGHLDLILSCPKANRVEIRWGSATADRFKTEQRIRLREIARGTETLDVDVQSSGATLRVLSKDGIHQITDIKRSGAPRIETLPGTAAGPSTLIREDLDGDGKVDLLTVSTASSDRAYPLRFRPGTDQGWGPEVLLESEDSRFLGIAPTTQGNLMLLGDRDRPVLRGVKIGRGNGTQQLPNPEIYPLSSSGIGNGSLAMGDLDGDGDLDIVITDAEESLLRPFWNENGQLTPGRPSPTLKKPTSILIRTGTATTGSSMSEVIVTSSEEGGAGRSIPEGTGFSFPVLLDDIDTSNLIAIGCSATGGPLVSLHKKEKRAYVIRQNDAALEFESGREPAKLHVFDSDSGSSTIVVEIPFETPRFFRLTEDQFEQIKTPATVESGGSVQAGSDGDLLIAKDGRCRVISIDGLEANVNRQIDAPGGSARVACALSGNFDENSRAKIVLVDSGQGLIHLSDGSEIFSSVEGPFQKVKKGWTADLDGDGIGEILLLDQRSLMVVRPNAQDWNLQEFFSRRHEEENSRASASFSGDLNGDEVVDILVIDGVRGELEILAGNTDSFQPALRFQVFEKKTFRGGGRGIEPRKVLAAHLDGDEYMDAAILVHDRLIIYPQGSGEELR